MNCHVVFKPLISGCRRHADGKDYLRVFGDIGIGWKAEVQIGHRAAGRCGGKRKVVNRVSPFTRGRAGYGIVVHPKDIKW